MSYDRAELEQIIRTGGTLPDELLDIFKKNAARRRSERAAARRGKLTQYALEAGKARESSSWTPGLPRERRTGAGGRSPNPVPADDPPQPLACAGGWTTIGNTFAPFSWGSQEQPEYISSPDGTHIASEMTRRTTGEYSLALAVESDPTQPNGQGKDQGLGFKGVEISATIGQIYFVAGQSFQVLMAQAQLAMNIVLWEATDLMPGNVLAVAGGSATITVSEFALDWTLHGAQSKQLGQSSGEKDILDWLGDSTGVGTGTAFTGDVLASPDPLNLDATLKHNGDAVLAMVGVDVDIYGFTQMSKPKSTPTVVYLDFRVADDDLKIAQESDDTYYNVYPYPSPIILTQTRLCGF